MGTELVVVEEFDQMQQIVKMHARGMNWTQIARETGIKRATVIELYDQWKAVATSDPVIRQMGRDSVAEMNEHYNHILQGIDEVIEEAKMIEGHEGLKIRNTALKNSADVSAKRAEFWQRAGLIEDAAMVEQIMAMEEKAEQIKELLKNVAEEYPQTRVMITEGLTQIFRQTEGVTVVTPGG